VVLRGYSGILRGYHWIRCKKGEWAEKREREAKMFLGGGHEAVLTIGAARQRQQHARER